MNINKDEMGKGKRREGAGKEQDKGIDLSESSFGSQKSSIIDNPVWFTTKDAAIYLRKFRKDGTPSEEAIRADIRRNRLRAKVWGRRLYIRRSDCDAALRGAPYAKGGPGWA